MQNEKVWEADGSTVWNFLERLQKTTKNLSGQLVTPTQIQTRYLLKKFGQITTL
jgi:ribose 5-phosphate isomerase